MSDYSLFTSNAVYLGSQTAHLFFGGKEFNYGGFRRVTITK